MSRKHDWLIDSSKARHHHAAVKDSHRGIINEGATYLALYYNRPATALTAQEGGQIIGFDGLKDLGFNVMAEAIRGARSQICQPLQARVTPIGGDYETLRSCEALGQVIDGAMELCNFADLIGALVVDGCLTGEGYGLVDVDPITNDITDVRLDPLETFFNFDRTEATTIRMFSRRKARARWKNHKSAIDLAPNYKPDSLVEVDLDGQWDAEDNIAVCFAWAEPVGDEPGKFVEQLLDGPGTILSEGEWPHPVPIFSFKWDVGHRGENDAKPLGRTIAPMHFWTNEMVRKMHDALAGAVPYVESAVNPKFSDIPYQWVDNSAGPVKLTIPATVSQDVRAQITDLREQTYREIGQSEDAAHGTAPPQFKSGVALSNWRELINKSMSQQHRGIERTWTSSARIKVSIMAVLYKGKKARARAMGTDVIEEIDFDKVNLPEKSYSYSFDVVSGLPKQLPQKIELLAFLEEKGQIDADEFLMYVNLPDFKSVAKRRGGPRALMELQISRALSDGELIPPSEVQDFGKLQELAGQALQAAQAQRMKPPAANIQALLHLYLLAKARAGGAGKPPLPAMPALPAPMPGIGGPGLGTPPITPTEPAPMADLPVPTPVSPIV